LTSHAQPALGATLQDEADANDRPNSGGAGAPPRHRDQREEVPSAYAMLGLGSPPVRDTYAPGIPRLRDATASGLRRIYSSTCVGLILILSFSLGLATTLAGLGLAVVWARRATARLSFTGPLVTALPALSTALILASASCSRLGRSPSSSAGGAA